ncbi:MAG TPA: hypothetical protein VFR78_06930 [Pyrinomonadaceae bacterium]|nr:hypothetical protein [Pyrinomonadaceae bacterium]
MGNKFLHLASGEKSLVKIRKKLWNEAVIGHFEVIESGEMDERLNHTNSLQEDGCLPGSSDFTLVPCQKTLGPADG